MFLLSSGFRINQPQKIDQLEYHPLQYGCCWEKENYNLILGILTGGHWN